MTSSQDGNESSLVLIMWRFYHGETGCPVTLSARGTHKVPHCMSGPGRKGSKGARSTNRGWEPPSSVYPRGQGDIPLHLWDRLNGGIAAWLLLSGKEEAVKKVCNKRWRYARKRDRKKKQDCGAKLWKGKKQQQVFGGWLSQIKKVTFLVLQAWIHL